MIRTPIPSVDLAITRPGRHGLLTCVVRAVRTFRLCRSRAAGPDTSERRTLLIKQDLAHLDRNQLRDIGLDRDAL